jgi:exodeoxyribonuclease V beta subunit
MGGIFYLFLRGMDPRQGPEAGVYRDRPEEALVVALDGYLASGEGA